MKTLHALWATGVIVAVFGNPTAAMAPNELPAVDPGARQIRFTGSYQILSYYRSGTPMSDHRGYQRALGHSKLTLDIPSLNVSDLVIGLQVVHNIELPGGGQSITSGTLTSYDDEQTGGLISYRGQGRWVTSTMARHTREFGGSFWRGPLAGAYLVAREVVETTVDEDGAEVSHTKNLEGILIVPGYADFALFDDVGELPPLKSITDIPENLGWQPCMVTGTATCVQDLGDYNLNLLSLNCSDLQIQELLIPVHRSEGEKVLGRDSGRVFGIEKMTSMSRLDENCGMFAYQGVLGTISGTSRQIRYTGTAGVFCEGPLASCLFIYAEKWHPSSTGDSTDCGSVQGVILIPDYVDLSTPQQLLNISTPGRVGPGSETLVAGFTVAGTIPRTILVRAVGPSLSRLGVTDVLSDPELKVFRNTELIASNDNWRDDLLWQEIVRANRNAGATPPDRGNLEPAVLLTMLQPGSYTIEVSGANGSTGLAMVEIYDLSD